MEKHNEGMNENSQVPTTGNDKSVTQDISNLAREKKDQQIKNEEDTERLRSERQSVIDGDKNRGQRNQ